MATLTRFDNLCQNRLGGESTRETSDDRDVVGNLCKNGKKKSMITDNFLKEYRELSWNIDLHNIVLISTVGNNTRIYLLRLL